MVACIKRFLQNLSSAIYISIAACFMIFIYAPLELYLGNQHEFWFKITDFMPMAWLLFFFGSLICLAAFAILKKVNNTVYKICIAIALGGMLCIYAEGNFLVSNLPPLDGTVVDFGAYPLERLKCIILWITVAIAVFALWKWLGADKLIKWGGYIALGLFGMLVLTAVTLRMTTQLRESTSYDLVFTEKDKYTMSTEQNLIIFSLDAISEDGFEQVLERYPEYRDTFADFTSFDNTISAYPFTSRSLPFVLTGEWYENKEPFQEYLNRSFGESPLLNRLWSEDYSVGIYLPEYQLSAALYEGKTINGVRQNPQFRSSYMKAKMVIKMAMLKYAPWDFKYFSYDIPGFNKVTRMVGEQDYKLYDFDSLPLYNQLVEGNPIVTTDEKCFKYIHFEGGHSPYTLNNEMQQVENGTYEDKVASALHITDIYLQYLKQVGVYENSAIIITTDHGFGYDAQNRVHPMMLVKGVGETHAEMQINSAPISYVDLQEAYQRLLDGKSSSDIFDWKEGEQRNRRCILYYYSDEAYMREAIFTGDADDIDSMYETGTIYEYKS